MRHDHSTYRNRVQDVRSEARSLIERIRAERLARSRFASKPAAQEETPVPPSQNEVDAWTAGQAPLAVMAAMAEIEPPLVAAEEPKRKTIRPPKVEAKPAAAEVASPVGAPAPPPALKRKNSSKPAVKAAPAQLPAGQPIAQVVSQLQPAAQASAPAPKAKPAKALKAEAASMPVAAAPPPAKPGKAKSKAMKPPEAALVVEAPAAAARPASTLMAEAKIEEVEARPAAKASKTPRVTPPALEKALVSALELEPIGPSAPRPAAEAALPKAERSLARPARPARLPRPPMTQPSRMTARAASPVSLLPGIGPGLVWRLEQAGYGTLAEIAGARADELAERLGAVGKLVRLDRWIEFAKEHAAKEHAAKGKAAE